MKNDLGIKAKMPKRECKNSLCPWHGHIKIRGRLFVGRVASDKTPKTAIVEWDYYNYVKKYERFERKKTRIAAHNPSCIDAKVGDTVRIGECRPISKTKRFVIIEKIGDKL